MSTTLIDFGGRQYIMFGHADIGEAPRLIPLDEFMTRLEAVVASPSMLQGLTEFADSQISVSNIIAIGASLLRGQLRIKHE